MESSGNFNSTPELDYERWIDVVCALCGRYTPGGVEPKTFGGRAGAGNICGFRTVDLSCNAHSVERTHRDFRFDGMEHYYAIFQMAGQSTVVQNDHTVELAVGDVALVDAARNLRFRKEERAVVVSAAAAPVADFPFGIRAGRWLVQAWRNTCRSALFPSHSGCR